MKILKEVEGKNVKMSLEGRLDTTTAPELQNELNELLNDAENLSLNFEKLDYISSAGLRVLLSAHKTMMKKGEMVITNVSSDVMDVFDITGFSDILNIQ